jgi:hypothetical protein
MKSFTARKKQKIVLGFRVLEIPLGMVRALVAQGKCGEGARKLVENNVLLNDLTVIQINEFDGSLTILKNADGSYKLLQKHEIKDVTKA